MRNHPPTYIIAKPMKVKSKERILKARRDKQLMLNTCNPSTQEAETRRSLSVQASLRYIVSSRPGWDAKTLPQNLKKKKAAC